MEILLWLVPSVVVTVAAMVWVSWRERAGREEVDRHVAAERLARAMRKDSGVRYAVPPAPRDRSTGIAVRPSRSADRSRRVS